MALQGTIDTIPLGDVLGLVASGRRTGRLEMTGDRGRAELWIVDGCVVGGVPAGRPVSSAPELVADALRFTSGEFAFSADEDPPTPTVEPQQVDDCLSGAAEVLAEWERIDAVVPSPAHGVGLVGDAPEDPLTLSGAEWRTVAAVAAGTTVAHVVAALGGDELAGARALVDLVERDLVVVTEPPGGEAAGASADLAAGDGAVQATGSDGADPFAHGAPPDDPEGSADEGPADEGPADVASTAPLEVEDDPTTIDDFPTHFPIDDLIEGEDDGDDPWTSPEMEQLEARRGTATGVEGIGIETVPLDAAPADAWTADPRDPWPAEEGGAGGGADLWADDLPWPEDPAVGDADGQDGSGDGTDEVLRQMSRLSPQAAEAIAAALGSGAPDPTARDADDAAL